MQAVALCGWRLLLGCAPSRASPGAWSIFPCAQLCRFVLPVRLHLGWEVTKQKSCCPGGHGRDSSLSQAVMYPRKRNAKQDRGMGDAT